MKDIKPTPITVGAEDGYSLFVAGGTYRILVSGKETGGDFATIEMMIPPNAGPGPHSHADFHESFYVLTGEVEVTSEAGTYTAKKGSYVIIPKGGIVHKFQNKSEEAAELLCTVVPAGLEEMFLAVGKPVTAGTGFPTAPPMDEEGLKQMSKIAEQYGQKLYPTDFLG